MCREDALTGTFPVEKPQSLPCFLRGSSSVLGYNSVLVRAYFRLKVNCSGQVSRSGPDLLTVVSTELEGWIQEVPVRTDAGSCVREVEDSPGSRKLCECPAAVLPTQEHGRRFLLLLLLTLGTCLKGVSCGSYGKV